MLTVVVLTGCQIAKKDESGQAKEELYGAYAVVGDRIPDGKIAGVKDKKGFVHFKKIKGYFLYKYMPEKDTVSMDGDPQLSHILSLLNEGQMYESLFFYNLFRNLALDFQSTAVMAYPFHNPRYISSQPVLHLLILLIP